MISIPRLTVLFAFCFTVTLFLACNLSESTSELPARVIVEKEVASLPLSDLAEAITAAEGEEEIYATLVNASEILAMEAEGIIMMDDTLEYCDSSDDALRQFNLSLPRGSIDRVEFAKASQEVAIIKRELQKQLKTSKEKYSRAAVAYNRKMAELDFKFTQLSGLPPGETKVLPKQFAIR